MIGIFKMRRIATAVVVALAMSVLLAAVASADTNRPGVARFGASGVVTQVGPGPGFATQIDVRTNPHSGDVRAIVVNTTNEAVLGGLVPGVTSCQDSRNSNACDTVTAELTGAGVLSLHTSTAYLTNVTETVVGYAPSGEAVAIYAGSIRGRLNGSFSIANATGAANGSTALTINRNGQAQYACILSLAPGATPVPISACQAGVGYFVPIYLNIVDTGRFSMDQFSGSMSDIQKIVGQLTVTVQGPAGSMSGTLTVDRGRALVVGATDASHELDD